jgi:hypothetical protein
MENESHERAGMGVGYEKDIDDQQLFGGDDDEVS